MKIMQSTLHIYARKIDAIALAALLGAAFLEVPNVVRTIRHAAVEADLLQVSEAREGQGPQLTAEAARYRALALSYRGFKTRYPPSALGVTFLAGGVVIGSLALGFWVRAKGCFADPRRPRFTVRHMMGVVAVTALLLAGFLFVFRSDAYLRWRLASIVSFISIIASPALLAFTATFFWPDSSAKR
jgi:hypothetical protein